MWSKGELVDQAYAALAMAGYVFDLDPEHRVNAGVALDAMMAYLSHHDGIQVGYALASSPSAINLDIDSGIPLSACEPVYCMLAERICDMHGKPCPAGIRKRAKQGHDALQLDAAYPPQTQLRAGVPRGAGARRTRRPYFPPPVVDELPVGPDGELDFLGG